MTPWHFEPHWSINLGGVAQCSRAIVLIKVFFHNHILEDNLSHDLMTPWKFGPDYFIPVGGVVEVTAWSDPSPPDPPLPTAHFALLHIFFRIWMLDCDVRRHLLRAARHTSVQVPHPVPTRPLHSLLGVQKLSALQPARARRYGQHQIRADGIMSNLY